MAIHHHLDTTGRAATIGMRAEDSFVAQAKLQGFTVQKSNHHQDIREHWDFLITQGGKSQRVEVKGEKDFAILHNGQMTRDFFLVEFVGVTGHDGWLYGKADLVAFEKGGGFYIVPRTTLVAVAEKLCSTEWVTEKKKMLYKSYGREGRQDEVSAILISDILATRSFSFWKK